MAAHVQAQDLAAPPLSDPAALADVGQQKPATYPSISIERVSSGVFRFGEIRIDKTAGTVTFPALVNMDKGLLEYLLVSSTGKTHESLLRTSVQPYYLQIAFLLLGFEGAERPISGQGAQERPKGEPVKITIEYTKDYGDDKSRLVTASSEEWIVKKSNNGTVQEIGQLDWVFTGSVVNGGRFLAQIDGSIIAVYHDPVALIDNASEGGESDEIWFVKEGSVPSVGTPVTVTIKAKK